MLNEVMDEICKNKKRTIEIIIILFGLFFLFFRAKYGYCYNDEPFIISLAKKLYYGQKLIIDEWNFTCNTGVLLLPWYAIFNFFNVDDMGIILAFRYVYCILWFLVCFYVYVTFNRAYGHKAIVIFLYMIMFSPLDYMSLSYTSFGLSSFIVLCCLFYNQIKFHKYSLPLFSLLLTVSFTVLIISYPTSIILYVLLLFLVVVFGRYSKEHKEDFLFFKKAFSINFFIEIVLAVIYLYEFVYQKGYTINDYVFTIKYMLANSNGVSIIEKAYNYFYDLFRYMPILLVASFLTTINSKLSKEKKLMIIGISYVINHIYLLAYKSYVFNTQILAFSILFIPLFFLVDKKKYLELCCFGITGIMFSMILYYSSNTKMRATSMGLFICGFLVFSLIFEMLKNSNKKIINVCLYSILVIQMTTQFGVRMVRTYYDDNLWNLDYVITEGAAKGLHTSYGNYIDYNCKLNNLYTLIDGLDTYENIDFTSLTFDPIIYLNTNMNVYTFSTWGLNDNEQLFSIKDKFETFYSIHNKKPDIVFINDCNEFEEYEDMFKDYEVRTYNGALLLYK